MINKITISIVMMIFSISVYASHYASHPGCAFNGVSEHLGVAEHVHNQKKFLHYLAATNIYQNKCSGLTPNGIGLKIEGVEIHGFDLERLSDYDSYNEGHRVSWVFYQFKGCKGIYKRFKKFGLETALISPYH